MNKRAKKYEMIIINEMKWMNECSLDGNLNKEHLPFLAVVVLSHCCSYNFYFLIQLTKLSSRNWFFISHTSLDAIIFSSWEWKYEMKWEWMQLLLCKLSILFGEFRIEIEWNKSKFLINFCSIIFPCNLQLCRCLRNLFSSKIINMRFSQNQACHFVALTFNPHENHVALKIFFLISFTTFVFFFPQQLHFYCHVLWKT